MTLQAALKTKSKAWQCQNRATQEVLLSISMRKQSHTASSNQSIISAEKISKLPKLKISFSLSPYIYKYLDGWVYVYIHFNTYNIQTEGGNTEINKAFSIPGSFHSKQRWYCRVRKMVTYLLRTFQTSKIFTMGNRNQITFMSYILLKYLLHVPITLSNIFWKIT